MNLAAKIAHNSLISSVTRVFQLAIALISVGLITRYLGISGFGNYTTVIAFYFLITAISDFGINQIFTREISRPKADESKIISNVLGLRLITLLTLSLIGAIGVIFLPYTQEIKNGIWWMFLGLIFSSMGQTLNSVFQKRLVMNRLAWRELIGKAVQLGLTFLAIKQNWGLSGVIFATVASYAFIFLATWQLAGKYVSLKLSFDKKYWKFFLIEAAPLGLAAFVNFLYFKADAILLSLLRNSYDVGIYGAAYKVVESLIYFPSMFMGLIMPVFSYNIFHRPKHFLKIASHTLKALWMVTIPLVLYLIFLAPEVIRIIAGSKFNEAVVVLQLLSPALGAIFLAQFFNSVLIVVNQQKKLLIILTGTAILNLILNVIFIPIYSYVAAATISAISEILVTCVAFWLTREWGIGKGKEWIKMPIGSFIISGAGMSLILFSLNQVHFAIWIGLLIKGISGGLIYLFLLFLTKAFTISEISSIFIKQRNEGFIAFQDKES